MENSLIYKGPVEAAEQPVNQQHWDDIFRYGSESDTGENSRQYLQERLLMSFKEFYDSLKEKEEF